jgi:SAM-dependent methyltransferase
MHLEPEVETIAFQCNICCSYGALPARQFHRELAPCSKCGAIVRFRGLMHALSLGLYARPIALPNFPKSALRGIGMTDSPCYANVLSQRLDYTNTYYHCEPRLDILHPETIERWKGLDFVISSDVLEHVPPPAQAAFDNVYEILKPGGLFVCTVPYMDSVATLEHFPSLNTYEVLAFQGSHVLVNRQRDGTLWARDDLTFHGGPGSTLEMRVFGRAALMHHLEAAGFEDIVEYSEAVLMIGYFWPTHSMKNEVGARDLSYIISARRPIK